MTLVASYFQWKLTLAAAIRVAAVVGGGGGGGVVSAVGCWLLVVSVLVKEFGFARCSIHSVHSDFVASFYVRLSSNHDSVL